MFWQFLSIRICHNSTRPLSFSFGRNFRRSFSVVGNYPNCQEMRVIVVGSGVTGLATAAMLHRMNIDVTVLEAAPHLHSHYQSPVVLWSNALSCLRSFGIGNFIEHGKAAPEEFFGVRDAAGKWILRIPNVDVSLPPMDTEDLIPSSCSPKATAWSLVSNAHADFNKTELASVPLRATYSTKYLKNCLKQYVPDLQFAKTVVDLVPVSDSNTRGGVNVVCSDGDVQYADMVVGADGMHSTVRRLVYPEETGAHSISSLNMTMVDGYVNVDKPPAKFGKTPCEIWGNRRVMNYYPLFHEGQNRIAFTATLFDNPTDITFDFDKMTLGEIRTMYRGVLSKSFESFGDDIAQLFREATVAVPVEALQVPMMPQWHNKRAVLAGDAAHGAFPSFLAQDTSLCIEDAAMLATALGDVVELQSDLIAHSFHNYERSRRSRVEKYVRQSQRARRFTMTKFPAARDTMMKMTPWWAATMSHRWLNDWSYKSSELILEPEKEYGRREKY